MPEILKVEGITKSYSNHLALSDLNLSVPQQSIFGLLGPNGAGKTTLIRIINQIINADAGNIYIEGELLAPHHIEKIGYLPEERGLYKKMKVGDQLMFLAQLKGLTSKEAKIRIKNWLTKFEILDWWNKKIEDLSKGMAQKIQFIATVIHEPKLIILDEPFSGFDPINADLIKDEILELREKGATVIFSTHRMESVEELSDHIALINKSEKILDGLKKDIKESHRDNTFKVDHVGALNNINGHYEILKQEQGEEKSFTSWVKMTTEKSPNELLKVLIENTEVHGFVEVIPTINEIFISAVKGDSDE